MSISDFFNALDNFLSNENVRWVILFLAVLGSYVYLGYQAFYANRNEEENRELAYLFNPSAGGYREVRGDLNSKPLFEWNAWEISVIVVAGIISVFLLYSFYKKTEYPLYIRVIQFILAWTHSVLLIFFLPVNPFHQRMWYNLRSVAASVCNNSLKELWLAFVFIVLLPLPGSTSHTERMTWLSLKLGVFYVVQNIMLGDPNYKIEPYTEHKILPESKSELIGYGILGAILLLMLIREKFFGK
jgi:hypothetical protein